MQNALLREELAFLKAQLQNREQQVNVNTQLERGHAACTIPPPDALLSAERREHARLRAELASIRNQEAGAREGMRHRQPVRAPLMIGTTVDMFTDPTDPPGPGFTHDMWCSVRDQLWRSAANRRNGAADVKTTRYLKRAALAMNIAQHSYGDILSVVGHQCGRLFTERAVLFLHATYGLPVESKSFALSAAIDSLKQVPDIPSSITTDLHALRYSRATSLLLHAALVKLVYIKAGSFMPQIASLLSGHPISSLWLLQKGSGHGSAQQ